MSIIPFIDWNGDGKIDPVDVGTSIATETDDDEGNAAPPPEVNQKSGCGCLTAALTFTGIATAIIFMIIGWS